jgi:Ribbon-helix-helix protein, copG family
VVGGRLEPVKKTSIYLDPDVDRALGRRATAEGTTKAALIRDALADAAAPATRVQPRACGVFDGPGDLSENVDRYLTNSGFGER